LFGDENSLFAMNIKKPTTATTISPSSGGIFGNIAFGSGPNQASGFGSSGFGQTDAAAIAK
jgi:hypothetical protein